MRVLVADPGGDQILSYLATNKGLIISQNSGKGVSRQAARCVYNRITLQFAPTQIATLVNGSGDTLHRVLARYRRLQGQCLSRFP